MLSTSPVGEGSSCCRTGRRSAPLPSRSVSANERRRSPTFLLGHSSRDARFLRHFAASDSIPPSPRFGLPLVSFSPSCADRHAWFVVRGR